MEEYNRETQMAKINAGLDDGNQFVDLIKHPEMRVVDGFPAGVAEKLLSAPTPSIPVEKELLDK